jgi:GAF domain-containing protein/anti-sigma regulatory factor (Ser/Thr protein kinase)
MLRVTGGHFKGLNISMPTDVTTVSGDQSLEVLRRELAEAREQQAAAAEILRVISSSPTDLQGIFAEIAASAARLCDAYDATIFQVDGGFLRIVAHCGPIPSLPVGDDSLPLMRGVATARAVLDRRTIHIADLQIETAEYPASSDRARRLGFRTIIAVPLIRAEEAVGAVTLRRTEARLFSDKQIALLETFTDQAVIAIENTRLFEAEQIRTRELSERSKELTESLEYQTATSEVLSVISKSPNDLQPVLDAIIETAARLCHADYARFRLLREGAYHVVARLSHDPDPPERHIPLRPGHDSVVGRVALERTTIHIPDVDADPAGGAYALNRRLAARTVLGVPLLKKGDVAGIIMLFRDIPQAFTERQIDLVETFANQANIAIENTRLFEAEQASKRELQESLEYQTAMSEVLGVISKSPANVQPVFDTIASSALRLCGAKWSVVTRFDGEQMHLASLHNLSDPAGVESIRRIFPRVPNRGGPTDRAIMTGRVVHLPDVLADPEYSYQAVSKAAGYRSHLAVPMLREGHPVGAITVAAAAVGGFSEGQVGLLKSFADQAVIAIENTRLFEAEQASKSELQESLEYQTAISEVLGVISRAPSELQPVLNAIVATARRLCDAERAVVWQIDEDQFRPIAFSGMDTSGIEKIAHHRLPIGSGSVLGRASDECRAVQVLDAALDNRLSPAQNELARAGNIHSILAVPLMRDGRPTGCLSVSRTIVQPFSNRQVALLETFADQAVIAIENTRLFEAEQASKRELTESLEQQTASSEVLQIISSSPGELRPVFDAMLENATRICEANFGLMLRVHGDVAEAVAMLGLPPDLSAFWQRGPHRIGPQTGLGRVIATKQTVHIADVMTDHAYAERDPLRVAAVELGGFRTLLVVPMLKDKELIGTFGIFRQEVRAFTDKQIELVTNFAKQAVIAIENTRLLNELRESLQQQTATADVLKVISRSAFDLQVVLDTLIEAAARLCGAKQAVLRRRDGERYPLAATYGIKPEWRDLIAGHRNTPGQGTLVGRVALEKRTLQIPDVFADPEFPNRESAKIVGFRAIIGTPLLRDGHQIGFISLHKETPGPFTAKQVQLLENFADQAVIAIENSRLFEEVQARTRELAKTVEDLEIASQHKSQFVANMSHELRTPLAAILGYAELMQEGFYAPLDQKSLDALTRIRSNGKHLLGLINTVLDIAKIESGQFTLNMSEYAIETLVETVRSATESLAQNKKLLLKTDVAKSLPVGLGDEQRLTQVLLNLVGNAIKFTDTGEVRIAATAVNGHFNVSVTDTGPGIPEEHQARIFEQFHQVDSSNTKAKGGTGLGLAIAKQIVEMHGGRIWVESMLGKGSTFQLELPTRAEFRKSTP